MFVLVDRPGVVDHAWSRLRFAIRIRVDANTSINTSIDNESATPEDTDARCFGRDEFPGEGRGDGEVAV